MLFIKLSNKKVYFNFCKEIYLVIINTYPNKKEVIINYLYKIKKFKINKIKRITNIKTKDIKNIINKNQNLKLIKEELNYDEFIFIDSLLSKNDIKYTYGYKFIIIPLGIIILGLLIFSLILILFLGLGPYFYKSPLHFGRSYFANQDTFKIERNYNNYFFNESTSLLVSSNSETSKDYNLIIDNNLESNEEGDEILYLAFTDLNGELINSENGLRVNTPGEEDIYYGEAIYNEVSYQYFIIVNNDVKNITFIFNNDIETLTTNFTLTSYYKYY